MSSVTHPVQHFLERIMSDTLEHDGKVSIGGRNITSLRFADDIDDLAEEKQELEALVKSTLEQLFQTMAPYQRFSQGLHKSLQLLQS